MFSQPGSPGLLVFSQKLFTLAPYLPTTLFCVIKMHFCRVFFSFSRTHCPTAGAPEEAGHSGVLPFGAAGSPLPVAEGSRHHSVEAGRRREPEEGGGGEGRRGGEEGEINCLFFIITFLARKM